MLSLRADSLFLASSALPAATRAFFFSLFPVNDASVDPTRAWISIAFWLSPSTSRRLCFAISLTSFSRSLSELRLAPTVLQSSGPSQLCRLSLAAVHLFLSCPPCSTLHLQPPSKRTGGRQSSTFSASRAMMSSPASSYNDQSIGTTSGLHVLSLPGQRSINFSKFVSARTSLQFSYRIKHALLTWCTK